MNAQHTPGPWTVVASGTPGGASIVAGHTTIASFARIADATVGAAAPEMLEALKVAEIALDTAVCQSRGHYEEQAARKRLATVRAAIAKATGSEVK